MVYWRKHVSLPFTGPSPSGISKLNRSTTVACWDGSVDASGNLLDTSGNARHLAPTASPITAVSTLQRFDGNRWLGRNFVSASSQLYSLAYNNAFNISSANHTITIIARSILDREIMAFPRDGAQAAAAGFRFANTNNITYYSAVSSIVVTGPLGTPQTDGVYHIIQVVCSGRIAKVILDGVSGTPKDITGFGINTAAGTIVIGGGISGYMSGDILYTRLDAEALTDAQLEHERNVLIGTGLGSVWGAAMDYSRAGTAYQTYNDGTMSLRPSGMPRVGDGVLIEAAATNLFTYTNDFSTNWTKMNSSIAVTPVVLPDGTTGITNTFHEDGTVGVQHYINASFVEAIGDIRCASIYVKYNGAAATPRNTVMLEISNGIDAGLDCYINIQYGYVSSVGGGLTGGVQIDPLGNGWFRINAWATMDKNWTGSIVLFAISGSITTVFDGQNQDSYFIWGPQLEAGQYPTSYTPNATTSTVNGRLADNLSTPTYRLRNTLADILSQTYALNYYLKLYIDFTQEPYAATFLDNVGSYTITKVGQPKHYASSVYGDYHLFDGVNDYYTTPFTEGNGNNFVAVVTPSSVSGVHMIACNGDGTDANRGWILYQTGTSVVFQIHRSGFPGVDFSATVANALVANKTVLITATFSTTVGIALYVDALTLSTQALVGNIEQSNDQSLHLGANRTGGEKFVGKFHFFAFIDYFTLTQADHNNMYSALKISGLLPLQVGSADQDKYLRIKFDYKGLAASQTGPLIEISGITQAGGTTDSNTNRVVIAMATTTLRASIYANGENIERFCTYTVSHDRWNSVDLMLNLSDLTAVGGTAFTVNDLAGTLDATMTGAKTLSLLDTKLRIGHDYNETVYSNAIIKNLDVYIAQS